MRAAAQAITAKQAKNVSLVIPIGQAGERADQTAKKSAI